MSIMVRRPIVQWKRGITREVILISRWAIKLPSVRSWRLFLRGLLANMQEAEWSRMNDPRLCPVRFAVWGGWLLVMPRVRICDDHEVIDYGEFDGLPVETKPMNYGHYDGRIVAVDYGS